MKKLATKHYWIKLKNGKRLSFLYFVTVTGFLSSLLLTTDAWSENRTYPLTPVISNFSLGHTTQNSLFWIFIFTLTISLISKKYRRTLVSLSLISLVILVLMDVTRLQPWVFHYGAILFSFSWFLNYKGVTNLNLLDTARIVVGGIYFWSGVQKINPYFIAYVFPWFTQKIWEPFGETGATLFVVLGMLVPFIEASFAVGFFSKKYRSLSIVGATSMIILVLTAIGPLGHNWNSSVWPWNIGIFSMVIVLFFGAHFSFKEFIKRQRKNFLGIMAFLVFWIMPAGNLIGLTDHYLSWSLYTGKVPEATMYGNMGLLKSLSNEAEDGSLLFSSWTMSDFNMVPYPEVRVFENVFKQTCQQFPEQKLKLEISNKDYGFIAKEEILNYECN